MLHDRLRARLLQRVGSYARLLPEVQDRPVDKRPYGAPRGTGVASRHESRRVRTAVTLDILIAVLHVPDEPVYRGEQVPPTPEPDERLVCLSPVPLRARLEEVVAAR